MQQPQNEDVHDRIPDDLHDASLGDVAKRLTADVSTLVRQEIELAKAELTQKGKQLGVGGAMFGGAALAGWMAVWAVTACVILLLALVMPAWVAALIVAAIWGAVGWFLAMRGRERVQQATPPIPEQTIESVKEDVQWLKNRN